MKKLLTYIIAFLPLLSIAQQTGIKVGGKDRWNIPYVADMTVGNLNVGKLTVDTLVETYPSCGDFFLGRIRVGENSTFTTIHQAISYLDTAMGNSWGNRGAEILMSNGDHEVLDSVYISLLYPIKIRGLETNLAYFHATSGLLNKPMFSLYSEVTFEGLIFERNGVTNWGDNDPENYINNNAGEFLEVKNCVFDSAHIAIKELAASDILLNYLTISNCTDEGVGIYNSTSTPGAFYDIQQVEFSGCAKAIEFADGDSIQFIISSNTFLMNPADTAIYVDTTKVTVKGLTIISGNHFGLNDSALIGFAGFTSKAGRYANVEINDNDNLESQYAEAKMNVTAWTTPHSLTSGTWTKANFNNGSVPKQCKMNVTNNKALYLPTNKRPLRADFSGNIQTSTQPATIELALVINGNTASTYGNTFVYCDVNNRYFNFASGNIVLPKFKRGDFVELYYRPIGSNESVWITTLNFYVAADR